MVKIGLQIKCVLECIADVVAVGEDFRWYLKLKCSNCGEVPDKWQYVTLDGKVPLKGGRGEANFVSKCKMCARENSLEIDEKSLLSYKDDDNEQFKTIIVFDCRGVEPVDFSPRLGWSATGLESGTKFNDVNLTEKEWYDYDDKAKESVSISDFEYRFVRQ